MLRSGLPKGKTEASVCSIAGGIFRLIILSNCVDSVILAIHIFVRDGKPKRGKCSCCSFFIKAANYLTAAISRRKCR